MIVFSGVGCSFMDFHSRSYLGGCFILHQAFVALLAIDTIFFYLIKEIVAYVICALSLTTYQHVILLQNLILCFIISQIYHFDLKILNLG